MEKKMNLLGAVTAHVIFISSIITFLSRLFFKVQPGHWIGTPLLLMVFPLGFMLLKAPELQRPFLYYLQICLMLGFIVLLFFIDFVFKYDFRQTQWMVISFVVFFFAGLGGMIGVATNAGRKWMISAVILFFIALILSFVQRAITGF